MSTPNTNLTGIVPSPASKKIGSVSTPLNQYSSPAPRSIPSPAARRDHAAKTPINHPTGSSQGARTVGATPMIASLSQQGNTASPAGGLLAGLTPTGLGVDLGTPSAQLGAGMAVTMSELGLTASGGVKRNEDEERRVKIRKILKKIGKSKGRVGEDGIARASRRVGFANDIDVEKLSAEERDRRAGNRTISIAGNTTVIDVELKNHKPQNVQVLFSTDLAGGNGQSERAASILLDNLKSEPEEPYSTTLQPFYYSLQRIARLDHLSSNRVSCFDAVSGIHRSLKRLEEQELIATKAEQPDSSPESHRSYVLHQRSGLPSMHENGEMGLSIHYWREGPQPWRCNKTVGKEGSPHRIVVEVGRCQAALYPPMRVSESWLPEDFDLKPSENGPTTTPWQEPAPTYLNPDPDVMADDSLQILPNLRFVAKLDPPVILPWQIAATIHTAFGTTTAPLLQMPSYMSLLLGLPMNAQEQHLLSEKDVARVVAEAGGARKLEKSQHSYQLNLVKQDVGFALEEVPFSHPKQLIELLPILRQWACIGMLLRRALTGVPPNFKRQPQIQIGALLGDGELSSSHNLPIELTLAIGQTPTLSLAFPRAEELCCCEVRVGENAKLSAVVDDIDTASTASALEISQDLSMWIEWLLTRPSPLD